MLEIQTDKAVVKYPRQSGGTIAEIRGGGWPIGPSRRCAGRN